MNKSAPLHHHSCGEPAPDSIRSGNPEAFANDIRIATPEESLPAIATCPLCRHESAPRLFFTRDRIHNLPGTFAVYRCVNCQAVFVQPRLSDAELSKYYPEEYGRYRYSRSLDKKVYRGWQRFVLENYYGYPAAIGRHWSGIKSVAAFALSFVTAKGVLPYRGMGKILDIGCGGGSYLYRLKQWGWETYGVEPSETGAKHAQSLGLTIHHGTLQDARFSDGFFDVVRLDNVLEHLRDPKATLKEVSRILKSDGLMYITVPNTRSLVFWLFQENWYGLDAPRHVISYSPRTLQFLCDATGFEIAAINFKAGPFNFVRSVQYFFGEKGNDWPAWIRNIRWARSKFIRRALKPFFFIVDAFGYGDFFHAMLRKNTK
jgi:SAM-dependent methyltransferase